MPLREVLGQVAVTRLMARLIARDRLPHALLLEGLPGCGRRTLAMAIAQSLLCQATTDGDACGVCASCRLVVQGDHPDLVSLPHDSQGGDLGVELVRDTINEAVFQSPLMGPRRVFVLPGIERLHLAASSTLLKVLEEPPAGVYLVMTTAGADAVLRTIRSRAQLFRLLPLPADDLQRILVRSGVDLPVAQARAALGAGSHRGLWDEHSDIPLTAMRSLCEGGLDPALVMDVVERLPRRVPVDSSRTLLHEQRHVLERWLIALIHELRPGLRGASAPHIAQMIERVVALQHDLQLNFSPHTIVEGLALAGA